MRAFEAGAIIGCVVALFSSVGIFFQAAGPVSSQFGLEAGLLLILLVIIALFGGLIVGAVASGLSITLFSRIIS